MMDGFLGSYLAFAVGMILTGAGLPVPEEFFIVAAGVLAANGQLDPFVAFACLLFGALAGDCVMYWIGYHFGHGVLSRRRWWARLVTPEREKHIENMFHSHGLKVFFVARFLVGLRSPVYVTAGILRLSFKKFVLIDLVCAAAVVGSFFALAYFFGAGIRNWIRRGEWGLTICVSIALAVAIIYLWVRYRRRKKSLPPSVKHVEDVLLPTRDEEARSDTDPLLPCVTRRPRHTESPHGQDGEATKKRSEMPHPVSSSPEGRDRS
jgi:membrane protein DedA with SNARE-associated domain